MGKHAVRSLPFRAGIRGRVGSGAVCEARDERVRPGGGRVLYCLLKDHGLLP